MLRCNKLINHHFWRPHLFHLVESFRRWRSLYMYLHTYLQSMYTCFVCHRRWTIGIALIPFLLISLSPQWRNWATFLLSLVRQNYGTSNNPMTNFAKNFVSMDFGLSLTNMFICTVWTQWFELLCVQMTYVVTTFISHHLGMKWHAFKELEVYFCTSYQHMYAEWFG